MQVVLANSEIANAHEHENQDLFCALKGGGPNFGIVTRFDLYTYPDYKVLYTFKMYSANETEHVMRAAVEIQTAVETDDRIGFFLTCAGDFVPEILHLGWTNAPVPAFKVFDEIAPMMASVPQTNGRRLRLLRLLESGTSTVLPDVDLYIEMQSILKGIADSATASVSYFLVFTFQPVAKASVREGLALAVTWEEDSEDELARKQIRELISGIETVAQARGLHLDFKFMNDASYNQSPLRSYGHEILKLLNVARQKWDSEGVFQNLQNGGFQLSKA